jgi:hypothetical protein
MTQGELSALADAWIAHWDLREGSDERRLSEAADLYDMEYDDPETLWLLILVIHQKDQSILIQQVLSAGPIETLLTLHGDKFIDRIEAEARRDPMFAKVLGGVWKNAMSDSVWERVQAVWDRRGWDGIPE